MNNKPGYTPKEQRKNILLLCDDIRVHSGIAQIGREIVLNTSHKYNFIQLAGAVKHPDKGKQIDMSPEVNDLAGISDSSVKLIPTDGYGDPDLIRHILSVEKVDAIFLITDPRYFVWLFQIENEIRKKVPIIYLSIWDSPPAPQYNREFYESCDLIMGISKQSHNIHKMVLDGGEIPYKDLDNIIQNSSTSKRNPILLKYVPHGINTKIFFNIDENHSSKSLVIEKRKKLSQEKEYDFILLFNSRNIRRKSIPDTILAWRLFTEKLPKEQAKKCLLVLHTEAVSDHGTDLIAVIEYLCPSDFCNVAISSGKLSSEEMNLMYNAVDGVILLSSNEGWGLSLTEALVTGTPFIANVTGGMQDQMRFIDNEGNWFTPSSQIPSNHRKTYTQCGEWVLPVFPTNLSLVGSVQTPYIFDDRCSPEDAANQIMELYNMNPEKRKEIGLKGMEWATGDEAGFTAEKMCNRVIESVDKLFEIWKPREKYQFITDTEYKPRVLNHNLIY